MRGKWHNGALWRWCSHASETVPAGSLPCGAVSSDLRPEKNIFLDKVIQSHKSKNSLWRDYPLDHSQGQDKRWAQAQQVFGSRHRQWKQQTLGLNKRERLLGFHSASPSAFLHRSLAEQQNISFTRNHRPLYAKWSKLGQSLWPWEIKNILEGGWETLEEKCY